MGRLQLIKQWTCKGQGELVLIQSPANRHRVEHFIRERFYHQHQARLRHFARHLVALTDADHQIQACLGYQGAHEGRLFLEQYLDQPIEQLLGNLEGQSVARRNILEVGNLASRDSGYTRRIILALGHYFYRHGFEWLVITATPQVLNTFRRLGVGLELIPLAPALPERLVNHAGDWGDYYSRGPVVVAARFGQGLQQLLGNSLLALLMHRAPQPLSDRQIDIAEEVA